jgi:chromate transporter
VNLFKGSPKVSLMTKSVQPIIAILLAVMAYQFFLTAYENSGVLHLLLLAAASYLALSRIKMHPSLVIVCALVYGGVFLS